MDTELLTQLGIFIVSLVMLIKGADIFVAAAEKIGLSMGISPFIIGATIVGFGTSLPELASSIVAVLSNKGDMVVGNVVGSNIFNIALVLGLVAIVGRVIRFEKDIMNIDMPMLVFSSFLSGFILYDGDVSVVEAILLLAGLATFLGYSFRAEDELEKPNFEPDKPAFEPIQLLWLSLGIILVYFGAEYTVSSLTQISTALKISPGIMALVLLAFGTSLPEIVVSITAARKGKTTMAVGNVIGSNIFNTFAVLSIPRFFGKIQADALMISFHIPFMIALTILVAIMAISQRISRWEGIMLILFFILFLIETAASLL